MNPVTLRRAWHMIGFALVGLVIYQSLNLHPIEVPGGEGNVFGHLLAYAVLMLWFSQIHVRPLARLGCIIGLVMLGASLEIVQAFTDYRTFDVFDLAANSAGVALGWVFAPPRLPNFLRHFESRICRR